MNDNTRTEVPEKAILLGVASLETKGAAGTGEPVGQEMGIGISEE